MTKFIKDVEAKAKASGSSQSLKTLGAYALNLVKDRTRAGFGVPAVAKPQEKLGALSSRYIRARRGMKLSRFTSPEKSNLTLTGSMLASLKVFVGRFKLDIRPTGSDKKGVSNQDKANWQEDQGRIFLRLSDTEIAKVTEFYQTQILDKIIK